MHTLSGTDFLEASLKKTKIVFCIQTNYEIYVKPLNALIASCDIKQMHPEDLKTVWLCCDCKRNFLFHSDVEDHKKQFNHARVMVCNISETARSPTMFIRGRISIGFKLNNKTSRIVIEYQYYPSTAAIEYVNVIYTDKQLQSKVEDDPEMMKNIDNYLRRVLNKRSASLQKTC